jgi:hydroxypyruvate isomerase
MKVSMMPSTSTVFPLSFNLRIVPGVAALFTKGALSQRLAAARARGFTGIDGVVPEDPRQLAQLLHDNDMQFVCMPVGRGSAPEEALGLAALPGRQEAFRDRLLRDLEIAASLASGMVHVLGGLVADEARPRCSEVYLENLRFACDQAQQFGIRVLIEPICAVRQPRYILHRHTDAIAIIDSLGVENLSLMADMFHAYQSGESIVDIAKQHSHRIGLFQVSDPAARTAPAANEPQLAEAIEALRSAQWRGWVSAEYVAQDDDPASLRWMDLLASREAVA